jgi:hypothetical protein
VCVCVCIDTIFAVFDDGTIVKADSCTNPCTIQSQWECSDKRSKYKCSHLSDSDLSRRDLNMMAKSPSVFVTGSLSALFVLRNY